jgi:NDP-sugar pyrophosphorylase family protein
MVPIVNRPVMEHLINLLKQHNFTEIMVNLHYLGDQIKAYFGDGYALGRAHPLLGRRATLGRRWQRQALRRVL